MSGVRLRRLEMNVNLLMGFVHAALGLTIIIAGEDNFDPPTYEPLVTFSFGHFWLWGITSIVIALLLNPHLGRRFNIVGLFFGMVWMIVWFSLFFVAVESNPDSAPTPMVCYGGFAMINAALPTAKVSEREE